MIKLQSNIIWKGVLINNVILLLGQIFAFFINYLYTTIFSSVVSGFSFDIGNQFLIIQFLLIIGYSYYLFKKKVSIKKISSLMLYYLTSFFVILLLILALSSLFGPTVFLSFGVPIILLIMVLSIISYWKLQ